ncbi:olfactory receptor 1468-like [Aquarana catesbeiana]|uniref:olfactory receptor 1468-like n=1 Tax=Aquarana catesbeiana TaxID=8400 RepID=UPI003CC9D311
MTESGQDELCRHLAGLTQAVKSLQEGYSRLEEQVQALSSPSNTQDATFGRFPIAPSVVMLPPEPRVPTPLKFAGECSKYHAFHNVCELYFALQPHTFSLEAIKVMNEPNITRITTIHFLGFQTHWSINCLIFSLLLLIYCVLICGNLLIITLVSYSKTLQSPMYFFLSQLAVSDILLATDILPNTLHDLLVKEPIISFFGCITQFYFFVVAESGEYFLLTAMSYDRYLAICKPLHYTSIMNQHFCSVIVAICWILSILIVFIYTITITNLQFCGPNVIDHYFCDIDPILQLSCSDTTIVHLEVTLIGVFFLVIPFFVIIISYIYIINIILKIPSIVGKQKVFSTCSSHLSVVCTYFGTLIFVYYIPNIGQSKNMTKFMSLLYTAGNPLMNPIIYSLRNKDLKQIVKNKFMSLHFKRD